MASSIGEGGRGLRDERSVIFLNGFYAPICGDGKYGGEDAHPGAMLARRLHLHAWQVKLTDGKVITAPLSPHFAASMEKLGFALPPLGWRFQDL